MTSLQSVLTRFKSCADVTTWKQMWLEAFDARKKVVLEQWRFNAWLRWLLFSGKYSMHHRKRISGCRNACVSSVYKVWQWVLEKGQNRCFFILHSFRKCELRHKLFFFFFFFFEKSRLLDAQKNDVSSICLSSKATGVLFLTTGIIFLATQLSLSDIPLNEISGEDSFERVDEHQESPVLDLSLHPNTTHVRCVYVNPEQGGGLWRFSGLIVRGTVTSLTLKVFRSRNWTAKVYSACRVCVHGVCVCVNGVCVCVCVCVCNATFLKNTILNPRFF